MTSRRPKKQKTKQQTKNAEIKLDHRTRSGFIHSVTKFTISYELDCARVPNRSFGGHHESRIKQLICTQRQANASAEQL